MFFKKNVYVVILLVILFSFTSLFAQHKIDSKYIVRTFIDEEGNSIDEITVPDRPPVDHREPAVDLPDPSTSDAINILSNVPAFDWVYGCSATSAAMMAGHYDNTVFPEMYTGPTNGGIVPMNNSTWGIGECPLSATHQGYDGLASLGHVDDYWISYGSTANDPYITGAWTAHTNADCTGDYMGTNQSALGNSDGATTFYNYTNGTPLYDYTGCEPAQKDGTHGLREFFESRGYSIQTNGNYSQYIYGYNGNTIGFTYDQFKAEIDAGRPVLIQVEGHTMLGFGYDDSSNLVYLHDTWDYSSHTMTWGGSYSGMAHYAVGVFLLDDPTITVTAPNGGENWDLGSSHNITWTSQDVTNVDIDLYNTSTFVYTIVGNYLASTGSVAWSIPAGLPVSTTYLIRISDSDAAANYDDSDAYFTLNNPGTPVPIIDVTPTSLTTTLEFDELDTQQMHITNIGDPGTALNYSLTHSYTNTDNISGSYVVCSPSTYTAGETTDWTLSVYNASPDSEWLTDVYVTFPIGVTVNSGTNFTGGQYDLIYDGSTGNGTTIHWYDANGGWGNIYGGQTATAIVNTTVDPSFIGDISLAYQIDGDIYGTTPHTVTGSITLIEETWLSYNPSTGSCAYGVTDDIDVTFDATGLAVGTYSADILITNNGGGPVTVPCTLNVIFPPDIDVTPSSFSENLYTNQTSSDFLTIRNLGGEQLDFTIVSNPVVSWLSLNSSGGFVAAFGDSTSIIVDFDTASLPHGIYSTDIVIDCNDPHEPQVVIPVTLTVHNDAPTISLPDDFTYAEDAGLIIDFSSYVNDLDNDPLTLNVSGNTDVLVSINDLEVTFGNTQDWNGTEILMFTVSDGQADATAADMVDVIVTPVNDPPVLNITGTFEADEDLVSITYDFSGFCSQTWGETDVLTLTADNSTHINVNITDFNVVFQSNTLNWNGTEDVTFYLDDNISDSGRAITDQTISVTINPVNDAPTITLPSQFNVNEDVPTTFDFTPYIDDVDGDVLTIIPSGNTNVTVDVTDYNVTFGNVLNWYGTETLTFIVSDGVSDAMAVDMADVVIAPVNDPPILNITGTFEAEEDLSSVTYDFNGFCSQVWGETDILTITADNSTHIDVTITDFDVLFESNTLNWNGTEDITIYLDDNVADNRDIVSQIIQVTINPVNDAPTITLPDEFTFEEDGTLVEDFVAYIDDVDPDDLTLSVTGNTEITVDIVGTIVTFGATENWFGTETLTFTVNDNVTEATAEDDVDVIISPVNDPPILNITGTFEAEEDLPSVTYDFSGFCSQVWGETDVLTLTADNSTHIDVTITDFDVTFQSNTLNWNGTEDITIYLDDNVADNRDIVSQVIQVTINPVNDAPTIILPDNFTFEEDGTLVEDFAAYIDDVDPDDLTLSVTGNTEITVDIVGTIVTFSSTENWFGTETLTFTVNDNVTEATAEDDVDVIVTPVNDPPTITLPDEFTFEEDGTLVEDFAAYIDDVDPDDLTLSVTGNTEITVDIVGTVVTFSSTENWFGTETLTFTVNDNVTEATAEDDVDVIVTPVNDPPILNITGTFEAEEDLPSVTYDFSGFCSQVWGETDILTLTADNSTHIDVTITDFDVIFESNTLNWNGTEDITIYLDDNVTDNRDIVSQVIQVTINPVNDAPTIILPDEFTFEEDGTLVEDFAAYIDDVDPDDLTLSVTGNTEITVDIVGTIVTFNSTENWFGTETLTFTVNDNVTEATAEDDVDVVVTPVNDEPVLIGFTPEELVFTVIQDSIVTFTVIAEDIDSDLTYEWLVDNELQTEITEEFVYQFSDLGVIEIKSVVSDEEYSLETIWDVTVDPATGSGEIIPVATTLYQNHPNPFNPTTNIRFSITKTGNISINIYNIKGEQIKTLVNAIYPMGEHNVVWNGKDNNGKIVSSGVYFYHMLSKEYSGTKKMILMK